MDKVHGCSCSPEVAYAARSPSGRVMCQSATLAESLLNGEKQLSHVYMTIRCMEIEWNRGKANQAQWHVCIISILLLTVNKVSGSLLPKYVER